MVWVVLVIAVLWAFAANKLIQNFESVLDKQGKIIQFLVCCVLIIGAPFFFIVELLEILLDLLLGENWDDE